MSVPPIGQSQKAASDTGAQEKQTAQISSPLPAIQIKYDGGGWMQEEGKEWIIQWIGSGHSHKGHYLTLTELSWPSILAKSSCGFRNPAGQGQKNLKFIQSLPVALEYLLQLPSLWDFVCLLFFPSSLSHTPTTASLVRLTLWSPVRII